MSVINVSLDLIRFEVNVALELFLFQVKIQHSHNVICINYNFKITIKINILYVLYSFRNVNMSNIINVFK